MYFYEIVLRPSSIHISYASNARVCPKAYEVTLMRTRAFINARPGLSTSNNTPSPPSLESRHRLYQPTQLINNPYHNTFI